MHGHVFLMITCLHGHVFITSEIQCPTEIPNGHIASSCARVFNDRCHFYCDDGFMKSPAITFLTCNGTAQWDWGLRESKTLCLGEFNVWVYMNFEPPHGKTNNLQRRKQRRRSASQ